MYKPAPGEVKEKTYRSTEQGNELTKEGLDPLVALQDRQTHLHGGGRAAVHAEAAAQAHSSLCTTCKVVLLFDEGGEGSDGFVRLIVFIVLLHIYSSGCEELAGGGRHGVGNSVASLVQS
jgi:hypothetical protein